MSNRTSTFLRSSLRVFSILVAVAALVCGARGFRRSAEYFRSPTPRVFSPEFRAQLRTVEGRLRPGEAILHVSAFPEFWNSRLWQRALYPRYEAVLLDPAAPPGEVQRLRSQYSARFAISAGDPPADPGFLWKVELGPLPPVRGTSWFGELKP